MSDFGETFHPTGRKNHRCELCWGPIPKGERHAQYRGMFGGEWQNWRAHEECLEEYDREYAGEEFMPGEWPMPEAVRQRLEQTQGGVK